MKHKVYLFLSSGYIAVNRLLAQNLGLIEAIVLSELLSKSEYFESEGKIDEDGFFYCTSDKLQEWTTLTYKQQKPAIDNLKSLGVLSVKLKGHPAKKHFRIGESEKDALEALFSSFDKRAELVLPKGKNLLEQKVNTSFDKRAELVLPKGKNSYNYNNNPNNNQKKEEKNFSDSFGEEKEGSFDMPTLEVDLEKIELERLSKEIILFFRNKETPTNISKIRRFMLSNTVLREDLEKTFLSYKEYQDLSGVTKFSDIDNFLQSTLEKDYIALANDERSKKTDKTDKTVQNTPVRQSQSLPEQTIEQKQFSRVLEDVRMAENYGNSKEVDYWDNSLEILRELWRNKSVDIEFQQKILQLSERIEAIKKKPVEIKKAETPKTTKRERYYDKKDI